LDQYEEPERFTGRQLRWRYGLSAFGFPAQYEFSFTGIPVHGKTPKDVTDNEH
jgi:hypothetical protein